MVIVVCLVITQCGTRRKGTSESDCRLPLVMTLSMASSLLKMAVLCSLISQGLQLKSFNLNECNEDAPCW